MKDKKNKNMANSSKKNRQIEENFNVEIAKEIYSTPLDKKSKSSSKKG